jgi:TfoX/Sxy family transcriptional regulator of competence genes
MPFSQSLALRIRDVLHNRRGIVEKRMFGGVVFMLHGNMLVGVWHDSLIARVGPEEALKALSEGSVRQFDITGKPMRGWVMVDADGLESDSQLAGWIDRAERLVRTLPKK